MRQFVNKKCKPLALGSKNTVTDRHDITEILLKVALNTIKQTNKQTSIIIANASLEKVI
jgi:hypothetical protein